MFSYSYVTLFIVLKFKNIDDCSSVLNSDRANILYISIIVTYDRSLTGNLFFFYYNVHRILLFRSENMFIVKVLHLEMRIDDEMPIEVKLSINFQSRFGRAQLDFKFPLFSLPVWRIFQNEILFQTGFWQHRNKRTFWNNYV